jgi:hypothetical protein
MRVTRTHGSRHEPEASKSLPRLDRGMVTFGYLPPTRPVLTDSFGLLHLPRTALELNILQLASRNEISNRL